MVSTRNLGKFCLFLIIAQNLVAFSNAKPAAGSNIKHIIVLMEENRSFDHFFGWLPGVNGLTGNEYNLVNSSDPNSQRIYVNKTQPWIAPCDPDHATPATTFKIFGADAYANNDTTNATMSGFVQFEGIIGHASTEYCAVMNSLYAPDHLPVATALASEFVLFDRFFAAHPGPTWPNRLFTLSGTSAGLTETGPWYHNQVGQLFPQKTFFDQVAEEGMTWRNYYNDTPWELFLGGMAHNPENLMPMDQFYADARDGNLPSYAWINPRLGANITLNQGSNDDHPDHDVALGEQFYKDIYEALRASPQWNETLFIITFDEHGGYYDHVPTPLNVPPPGDGETSYPDAGVEFDRLGIRIPCLLISPLVPKGLVLSEPPATQKPAPNSEYTLTSIMATARKLLNMESTPLTKRDAWSATFEQVFLSEPRTDCPVHLPAAPPPSNGYNLENELSMRLNDLQKQVMTVHAHLAGVEFPHHIQEQGKVGDWAQEHLKKHVDSTVAWKQSQLGGSFSLLVNATGAAWSDIEWTIYRNDSIPFNTIAIRNNTLCIAYNSSSSTGLVGVTSCYPSANPSFNRDPAQQWVFGNDGVLRSYANMNMCLTNALLQGDPKVYLLPCNENNVAQHWSWGGTYEPGNLKGAFVYGASIMGLQYVA